MKKIPKNYTLQRAIAFHLQAVGATSMADIQTALRRKDVPSHVASAVNLMIGNGWIEQAGDKFQLTRETADDLAEEQVAAASAPDVVPPRVIDKMHGTLNPKYLPSPYGTRADTPRREFNPVPMGSNVPPAHAGY